MKLRRFLSVVPKAVRVTAAFIFVSSVLLALLSTAGFLFGHAGDNGHRGTGAVLGVMVILFALLLGSWLLCLGFIYGDAKRRAMQPVLWILIAILVPHLLGFLLYFVLRQPITMPCTNCGQKNSLGQRYCSWCGNPQPPLPSGDPPLTPGSPKLDSTTAV